MEDEMILEYDNRDWYDTNLVADDSSETDNQ